MGAPSHTDDHPAVVGSVSDQSWADRPSAAGQTFVVRAFRF
ncbi:hypothetical protein ACFVT1_23055 [Streptomyces sp. NPDC057963]